jgi:hypothetical protein
VLVTIKNDLLHIWKQMKKSKFCLTLILTITILGCDFKIPQIVNDPPSSEFSFGFKGRLEKLEDAFYSSNFDYQEFNYLSNWQKDPEYEFTLIRSDTILNYVIFLQDCQSIYYLVNWNDNWNCDSSYIHIDKYSSNKDSIPKSIAKSIFNEEIIKPLNQKFNSMTNEYHWTIQKTKDTTYVKILNQNNALRKLYIYALDSIGNSIAEKEIFNYLGDSTIHYIKSQSQRFMYLESKEVTKKNSP